MKNFFLFGKEQWFLIYSSFIFILLAYLCSFFSEIMFAVLLIISYLILGYLLVKQFTYSKLFSYFLILLLFCCSLLTTELYLSYLILLLFSIEQLLLFKFPNVFFDDINKYLYQNSNTVILKTKKGNREVNICEIKKGDTIIISSGMTIPVDGVVNSGNGVVRLDFILENRGSKSVDKGSSLLSGSVYFGEKIELLVQKNVEESFQQQILKSFHKVNTTTSPVEKNVNRIIWTYQVLSLILFILFFFIPYLITGSVNSVYTKWSFFFLASGSLFYLSYLFHFAYKSIFHLLARNGILLSSKEQLQAAINIKNLVFSKTGVLTLGKFRVTGVEGKNKKKILNYIYTAEQFSNHPISEAVREYGKYEVLDITDYKEIPSRGISYMCQGKEILIGNYYFLKDNNIIIDKHSSIATVIYVVEESKLIGMMLLSDMISSYVLMQINDLKESGFKNLVVFSADNEKIVGGISREIGIPDCYSNLTQEEKSFWLHYLKEMNTDFTAYIGEEGPDDRLLKESSIGIVLGNYSNKFVTILDRDLSRISSLVFLTRRFMTLLKKMITLVISMKVLGFLLYLLFPETYFLLIGLDVLTIIFILFLILRLFRKDNEESVL